MRALKYCFALQSLFEQRALFIFQLFLLVSAIGLTLAASSRYLWNDELFTLTIARLPSLDAARAVLLTGVDPHPPAQYLSVRAGLALSSTPEVGARLGSIVAYLITACALFGLLCRVTGPVWALNGVLLLSQTKAIRYAYEARGYSWVIAFCALALFAFHRLASTERKPWAWVLLTVGLAGAVSAHFYAALLLPIFALGTVCRTGVCCLRLKHIAPFLPALGLLFAYFPLIQAGRKEVSHFWSPATASSLFDGYAALFPDGTGLTVVFILLMLTLSSYLSRSSGAMPNAGSRAYDATDEGDLVVLIALILAPACCVLLGVFVTGGYVPRYTIYTVLGVIIITILVGAQLRNPLAPLAVFLVLTASFVRTGIIAPITSFQKGIGDPARIVVEELNRLNGADLVIPRGTDFFRYWHYAPATHRNRIVYLTDSAAAAGYTGANTADRTLQLFKPVAGFPVQVYADYVATHQVVYVLGSHDWILRKLKDSGAKIEILRWTGEDPLFRVDLPG